MWIIWPDLKSDSAILIICMSDEDSIKMKSLSSGQHLPKSIYMSMWPFGCRGNQSSDQTCPQNLVQPIPNPNDGICDLIKIAKV